MIEIKNLSYAYSNGNEVLKEINLVINKNEITMIVGKNGTGKSTLANFIAGIYSNKNSDIRLDGKLYKEIKDIELRKKVGIVFQNPNNQIIFTNVYDDLKFTLNNLKLDRVEERIDSALKLVGMQDFKKANPYELSFGQKQRIAIANALSIEPDYLILDEVTSMLDYEGRVAIYEIIRGLRETGIGIVFITNNIDEIRYADRVVFLKDKIIYKISSDKNEIINCLEELEFDLTFYFKVLKATLNGDGNAKKVMADFGD